MIPAAAVIPAEPEGREVGKIIRIPPGETNNDEHTNTMPILISTMTVFTVADSLAPADKQQRAERDQDHRGKVEDPALLRRLGQTSGIWTPNRLSKQFIEILGPTDGDSGGGHAIFEKQAAATAIAGSSPIVA